MATTTAARPGRRGHLRIVAPHERAPSTDAHPERAVAMLLLSTAALTLTGLVMVLSASSVEAYARFGSSFLFFKRQLAYAAAGTVLMAIAARMRYRAWRQLSAPLLLISGALLVLVLHPAAGTVAGGSARWLTLGPVTIQPSELAKLGVVAFAAALLARRWQRLDDPRQLALPLVPVVGVVCGLVLLQPDLGTTIIIASSAFATAFAAGARVRHLLAGGLAAGGLGLGLIYAEAYRWARFLSFLNPWADPQGNGYQVIQSLIALASGGPFGMGLGASRQKWLYVPNAHTDFIYAIIGEEFGMFGMLVVLLLFGMAIYAGIRIALLAPDAFGRLLAAGITGWMGVQVVVNLGAVTGLLPITGVPLPFVSFGGSSLVVSLLAVGVLVSVGREPGASRAAGR